MWRTLEQLDNNSAIAIHRAQQLATAHFTLDLLANYPMLS